MSLIPMDLFLSFCGGVGVEVGGIVGKVLLRTWEALYSFLPQSWSDVFQCDINLSD